MTEQPNPQQNHRHVQTPAEKKKRINDEFKQQAEINKKRWIPLVRFMKKYHIKFKTARTAQFRIEYFRTDDFEDLIVAKKDQIANDPLLNELIKAWKKQVIFFQRPQTSQKLKYPKELIKSEGNVESKFASFKFDTAEQKTWLFPTIIVGVIAAVLWPLWPYALKYALFMICLTLVIAILSIIVIRLVAYLIFAVFGVSFWILPNFFADVSIAESFIPVYSSKKWQSGTFSIIGRLLALLILSYYGYHAYIDPSWIYENIEITKTSVDDVHDWGVGKIKGEKNFSQSALTNLDHIMNQTAEAEAEESESVNLENAENGENAEDYENNEYAENEENADNAENQGEQQQTTEKEEETAQGDEEQNEEEVQEKATEDVGTTDSSLL